MGSKVAGDAWRGFGKEGLTWGELSNWVGDA
jgi:hypothetical protein